ncbi:hypothetical protein [Streptomyces vietnamensis]
MKAKPESPRQGSEADLPTALRSSLEEHFAHEEARLLPALAPER